MLFLGRRLLVRRWCTDVSLVYRNRYLLHLVGLIIKSTLTQSVRILHFMYPRLRFILMRRWNKLWMLTLVQLHLGRLTKLIIFIVDSYRHRILFCILIILHGVSSIELRIHFLTTLTMVFIFNNLILTSYPLLSLIKW